MTSTNFVMLSFAISHGIPLIFAVRELMMLGNGKPRGGDDRRREAEPPRAPKPLPDCLLPRPVVAPVKIVRSRVLEDA